MKSRRWQSLAFNWNWARAFLVTAEEGSLSEAARALELTQPTLSRQVAALEHELGLVLFERVGRSLLLTDAGVELLDYARAMGEAASGLSLAASGQSQGIEGRVSITASDLFSAYLLPPILERLRVVAPGIEVEVVASNEIRDLTRREADIALRSVRPEQPDLIARHVRNSTAHLYASPAYLARHGRPRRLEDLADAVFVAAGQADSYVAAVRASGLPVSRANVRYSSESGIAAWEMVKHGLGMTMMFEEVGEVTAEVERVLPELGPVAVPMWLATHRELRTSRKIRVVFDLLTRALAPKA